MFKIITTIIITLLLSLTVYAENKDSYQLRYFGEEDKVVPIRKTFTVELVFYDNEEQLQSAWDIIDGSKKAIRGFALVSRKSDKCFINIIPPKIWDDREAMVILGHELMHCTFATHKDAH